MLLQLNGIGIIFSLLIFAIVLTVPGYFWTLAFYPKKSDLKKIERAAFSILFSVTFLPMFVLLENTLFGVPVEFFSVFSTLLVLAIISLLIYLVRTQRVSAPEFLYKLFPKVKKDESVKLIPKMF